LYDKMMLRLERVWMSKEARRVTDERVYGKVAQEASWAPRSIKRVLL